MTQTRITQRTGQQSVRLNYNHIEIIKHLADGLSVKEIATLTKMTCKSVSGRLETIRKILNVKNSSHMVAVAIMEGII